jgi:hypothetical protein
MWTKDIQNAIFSILICGWLGGMALEGKPAEVGRLLTIEEVGQVLNGKSNRCVRLRSSTGRNMSLRFRDSGASNSCTLGHLNHEIHINTLKFLSTSKIAMPSTSPSKSICNP